MDGVLAGLKWYALLVYIDDIVVFGKDFDTHLRDVERVLQRLQDNNLQLSATKCHFFKREIVYLGHVLNKEGIGPDPMKIKAMLEIKKPTKVSELRSVLSYYRQFVKGFATICAPLYAMLGEDDLEGRRVSRFLWGDDLRLYSQPLRPLSELFLWNDNFARA